MLIPNTVINHWRLSSRQHLRNSAFALVPYLSNGHWHPHHSRTRHVGILPRRSTLLATAVAVAGFGALGFASIGLGAVIVGETRRIDLSPKAAAGIDAMKAQYKRPATIPFPKENPYTPEKAALGKKLYFDTRLSVTSAQSCASCHSPGFGWGDGLAVGVGHGMAKLGRHSPTIVNAAWGEIFMWDGRLATLEEQALGPIQAAGEMNMPLEQLMERLTSIARIQAAVRCGVSEAKG